MKKIIFILIMLFTVSLASNAQSSYKREGKTFVANSSAKREKSELKPTGFNYKDRKGNEYPIYVSTTGSCFVIKTSAKTGKEYRQYMKPEMSEEICKELGIKYTPKKK